MNSRWPATLGMQTSKPRRERRERKHRNRLTVFEVPLVCHIPASTGEVDRRDFAACGSQLPPVHATNCGVRDSVRSVPFRQTLPPGSYQLPECAAMWQAVPNLRARRAHHLSHPVQLIRVRFPAREDHVPEMSCRDCVDRSCYLRPEPLKGPGTRVSGRRFGITAFSFLPSGPRPSTLDPCPIQLSTLQKTAG